MDGARLAAPARAHQPNPPRSVGAQARHACSGAHRSWGLDRSGAGVGALVEPALEAGGVGVDAVEGVHDLAGLVVEAGEVGGERLVAGGRDVAVFLPPRGGATSTGRGWRRERVCTDVEMPGVVVR